MTPACRWLKVDWDAGTRPVLVGRICWLLARAGFRVVTMMEKRSPGGRGRHAWLEIRPTPTFTEIVALQAILGSDPSRESCNLARASHAPRVRASVRRRWNVTYSRSLTVEPTRKAKQCRRGR